MWGVKAELISENIFYYLAIATKTSRFVTCRVLPALRLTQLPVFSFSDRQGSAAPGTVITGPDAWYAKDYVGTEKHIYRLTETDLAELDAAVASVVASNVEIKVRH